jgi:ribosomal protein S27E
VPTLFVRCRSCGQEIPTPVAEPVGGARGVMITGLKVRCPKCGQENLYSTGDFHLPAGAGGAAADGGAPADENLAREHEGKLEGAQVKLAGFGIVPPEGRSPHEGSE